MKYDYLYKEFLEKVDRLEALRDLSKEVHPSSRINDLLKRLDTEDWSVRVNEKLRWCFIVKDRFNHSVSTSLKIASFEDFKKNLIQGLADFLVKVVAFESNSLKQFLGDPLRKSAEIEKKIDEDLYTDLMIELRSVKEGNAVDTHKKLKAKIKDLLASAVEDYKLLAKVWVEEKLDKGMTVFLRSPARRYRVNKITRSGGLSIICGSKDKMVTDIDDIDCVLTWRTNEEGIDDLLGRLNHIRGDL